MFGASVWKAFNNLCCNAIVLQSFRQENAAIVNGCDLKKSFLAQFTASRSSMQLTHG